MDAANNLWTTSLRREQLLELLEGRGPRPIRVGDPRAISRGNNSELLGIWSTDKENALSPLPQLIVADRSVLDDLFAWSASYLRAFGPLSAIIRTLTPAQFDSVLNRALPSEPWKIAGGAIGLIIGEILSHSEKIPVETAAAATPNSTLAFAMLRAWYLGQFFPIIHTLFSNIKAWLVGTHHGVSAKHLPRYLREWSYRFNRRNLPDGLDRYLIRRAVECATITYDQLTAGVMPAGATRVRRLPDTVGLPALVG